MPKVSVIVPVYNTELFLRKCLDTILSQTLDDIEIIIVEDCSTDNSYKICCEYARKYPTIIRLIRQAQNSGVAAARNIGIKTATGKYIAFVDSDDYLDKNMLEEMYNACEKNSAKVARVNRKLMYNGIDLSLLSRSVQYKKEELVVPGETNYLIDETPACTNKIFLREFIDDDYFPTDLKWEDYPYTIPILARAKEVVVVPNATYYYNLNTGGTTVTDFRTFNPKVLDIFDGSDMIEQSTETSNEKVKDQLNFIKMQNCMQRLRDILYSDIPYHHKKELMTLVAALIKKKYGDWQNNPYYHQSNKRTLYRLRMQLINGVIEPYDTTEITEEELRGKVKEKIDDIKKQS